MDTDSSSQTYSKKEIADAIFNKLNPHFSALLGANQAFGFQTSGNNLTKELNEALKDWFDANDSTKLVALLQTAQVTNALSEQELQTFIEQIESAK